MRCITNLLAMLLLGGLACARGVRADDTIQTIDTTWWRQAVEGEISVTFTGFQSGQPITDQYADLGVIFGGDLNSVYYSTGCNYTDAWGIHGNALVELHFDPPISAVLFENCSNEALQAFRGEQLVADVVFPYFDDGGFGMFFRHGGIDRIRYFDPDPEASASMDNVHFATSLPDCDDDGEPDVFEIAEGAEPDCDGNAVPDACDIASGAAEDCNGNGVPDSCEVVWEFRAESVRGHVGGSDFDESLGAVAEAAAAAGPVRLWLWARGDLDEPTEWGIVWLNDTVLVDFAWVEQGPTCVMPGWTEFEIDPVIFNQARSAANGEVRVRVEYSGAVDLLCGDDDFIQAGVIYHAAMPNDADANGIPDDCQCPADLDGDGAVGLSDLLALLAAWGRCADYPEDLDHDGAVGFADLLALLGAWGACG